MMPESRPASSGAAAYRRRLTPKQMEAEVFARATRAIRQAEQGSPLDRARAIADNRRLWEVVEQSVLDPANALPVELRGRIVSIARAVLRDIDGPAPDLGFVAEMNDSFAAGLWQ